MKQDIVTKKDIELLVNSFYEKVKQQLQTKQNWTDSDDLAMLYQGNYSAAFYKHLHRHTHKVFRKQKSIVHLQKICATPTSISTTQIKSAVKLPLHWIDEKISSLKLQSLLKK